MFDWFVVSSAMKTGSYRIDYIAISCYFSALSNYPHTWQDYRYWLVIDDVSVFPPIVDLHQVNERKRHGAGAVGLQRRCCFHVGWSVTLNFRICCIPIPDVDARDQSGGNSKNRLLVAPRDSG